MYQPRVNCVSKNSITNKHACFNYCIFGAYAGDVLVTHHTILLKFKTKEPRNHGTLLFGNAYKNTYERPGRDSNPDRWLRRPLLYPAELPGHV